MLSNSSAIYFDVQYTQNMSMWIFT